MRDTTRHDWHEKIEKAIAAIIESLDEPDHKPIRWPKSLATLALLAIVRRVPPGAVRCRSLRSRHRPSPGLRRSLKFAKSLRQENASIFYDSGTSQTRRTLSAMPNSS